MANTTQAKKEEQKSVFDVLYSVDVNAKKETKNGLSYLSWAWAWAEAKKRYPDINYKVYEDEHGCMYHTDGRTCWVKCGVTINGVEQIEYLGIMDYRNQSIPLAKVTSTDAVKAVQRCVTKCIGRFGLGLYIYAGEDLPEDVSPSNDAEGLKTASESATEACSDCGKAIGAYKGKGKDGKSHTWSAEFIAENSKKKTGRCLCWDCWMKEADRMRAQAEKEAENA